MRFWLLLAFFTRLVTGAHLTSPNFPGYGFKWYDLVCGFACYNSISNAPLQCTSTEHSSAGHSHGSGPTTPECRAADTPFLTTLAYCMKEACDKEDAPVWRRERFWNDHITGDATVLPKYSYGETIAMIKEVPTVMFNSSSMEPLNETQIVPPFTINMQTNFMVKFDYLEMLQARYSFVLITIGFGTPILFTILARLPFMTRVQDALSPYLVYPSLFRGYHVRPLPWLLGNVPTVGQALYIFMFFLLNLVLSAIKYDSAQPHPWWFPPKEELLAYIGYRTGHIGYALLPLLILFSGRNNFLLWVTNWSYGTYLLLHRWVARIFAAQAIIHSITLLICYMGTGGYATDKSKPYWLWGIVATVLTCVSLVASHLYFRRLSYEVFLILHIVLAVFIIVGCWYHVILKWGINWYDNWLYAASAVWFFDRLLRVGRITKNGMQRSTVTDVGTDHVRIDVKGLRWVSKPGYVAYAYFPTLNKLRPWENHPFSINSTTIFRNRGERSLAPSIERSSSVSSSQNASTSEKGPHQTIQGNIISHPVVGLETTSGVTLIVKKNAGLTRLLNSNSDLLTLIDGPYPQHPSGDILECDHILLLGGGIGITGLLAWAHAHPNVKLAWSVKEHHEALVKEVQISFAHVQEKEVVIGGRLNVDELLIAAAGKGYKKVGVVVCGPPGMCDDVRSKVSGFARGGETTFRLEVEAFSW